MHLDFRVKPENDRKDTFGTSPQLHSNEVRAQPSEQIANSLKAFFSNCYKKLEVQAK